MNNRGVKPWKPREIGIGVDLGMTYSGAALAIPRPDGSLALRIVPIRGVVGVAKFPTAVFVSPDRKNIAVGRQAYMQQPPGKVYELFKRRLGTPWRDVDGIAPDATFLATQVLKEVKWNVEADLRQRGYLDDPEIKKRYVFSYPGIWSDAAQYAFRDAIIAAEFNDADFRMVDEAVATAIGIVQEGQHPEIQADQELTFICDFGGGTTDFALVQATEQGFVSMKYAAGGNAMLGMSNLDKVIALLVTNKAGNLLQQSGQHVIANQIVLGRDLETAWSKFAADDDWKSHVLMASEAYKIAAFPIWTIFEGNTVRLPDGRFQEITKQEFQPFVNAMLDSLRRAIQTYLQDVQRAGQVAASQIRYAAIGGGGSALPGIVATIESLMPQVTVLRIDPALATSLVQRGAAFHAFNPLIFERRAAKSYGIRTYKSVKPAREVPEKETRPGEDEHGQKVPFYPYYEVFLPRNKIIDADPVKCEYTPIRANQEDVDIEVFCGESDDPSANEYIGTLKLPLAPNTPRDYVITCSYSINSQGFLAVTAVGQKGEQIHCVFERRIHLRP